MKSFKNFNESAAGASTGRDTEAAKKKTPRGFDPVRDIKNAAGAVANFVNPPASRSNEPTVRSGERTPKTGFNYVPSRDKKGERYDKTGIPAPAKLDKGTRGTTMPSNPQFKGVGARTKKTETPKGDTPPGGNTSPTTAPKQPRTAKEKAYGSKSTLSKDKQAVNKEYDRLRNSKDPKERAKAAKFGKDNSPLPGPKSPNPLMKRFGDRDARKKELAKIRRDAKDASIAQSPNAEKIKKKETAIRDNIKSSMKRQVLGDRAKAKQGLDPSKPTPKDQLPKGTQQARTGAQNRYTSQRKRQQ